MSPIASAAAAVERALPRRPARRLPAPSRPIVVDALGLLAGIDLGITLVLGVSAESTGSLHAPGDLATAAGRLTGLFAGYAMVFVFGLVARFGPL